MLQVSPKMINRLDDLEADLITRRARAQAEGWAGELEGLDLTLQFLRAKRDDTQRRTLHRRPRDPYSTHRRSPMTNRPRTIRTTTGAKPACGRHQAPEHRRRTANFSSDTSHRPRRPLRPLRPLRQDCTPERLRP